MTTDLTAIIIAIAAAVLSGMGTAIIAGIKENKKEKTRRYERDQDNLKIELKDAQIKLYQLEKDLIEWKDKYYQTIEELISIKAELEETLIKLSLIDLVCKED
jgi:uncharacterized protein YlxW (UPF0749 family)